MAKKEPSKQGRKPGLADRRTADIAVQAALKGITPIEVMLDNMRFAHESALDLVSSINKMMAKGQIERKLGEGSETVLDMYREMLRLRSMAQDCAQGAAPYIHPKYTTIQLTDKDEAPIPFSVVRREIIDQAKA